MATASKSFTATGAGTNLSVRKGETFTLTISGTWAGTVVLQRRAHGSQWENIDGESYTANQAAKTLKAEGFPFDNTEYRMFCTAYTSGTIVTTLADVADVVHTIKDAKDADKFRFKDGGVLESVADHFQLNSFVTGTDHAGKTVRLNSITSIGASNDLIGFQSKPAQGIETAKNVIGMEISPRVNDTFALTGGGSLIGGHIDAYLKGETGNIAGSVRGLQIELVTDDAGARNISGHVAAIRVRSAFSATAITGKFTAFRIEKPEAQTNSKTYDALFDLTNTAADCWNDDPTTELNNPGGTVKGYIKVVVNGNDRYIALYEKGNLAD